MKTECPACGKLHNCKSNKGFCPKCKQGPFEFSGATVQFGDSKPVNVKGFKIEALDIQAMYERRRRKDPPPLDNLFLMPEQVKEIPTSELRRNCGGDLAFKGIPVTVYYRESDMLADFFVECMEQKRRVAYIDGDTVVRSDT